ncbi:N-acetylmuramoyl-L-alanine amidase [Oscillochloris trichoides DG-6]|uniref:N-acetylmuramoyl-L-alanine amidase n=1 Tax=Oscillochloris trichoides DG-6 TaxID=765420 RepID=E1IG71_9CHLR|nr:M15 family metallopeptidase [Oscillochloris trichoides]EFO79805.1 N-acetylmuramoyl-L-alanine amidase [Oscillochloris trichoides DG-6]
MDVLEVQDIGRPEGSGSNRGRAQVELIVLSDEIHPTEEAIATYLAPRTLILPHYHIDRRGTIRRFVDMSRAGRGLGQANYQGFSQRIDPIAISIRLQKRITAGYDGPLLRALHALLESICAHYWLDQNAITRIVYRTRGQVAVPYVPPPAPAFPQTTLAEPSSLVLGAAPATEEVSTFLTETYETELPLGTALQEDMPLLGAAPTPASPALLWELLYAETCKPRGGTLHFDWAFTIFAATKNLGAPVAPNPKQPLILNGVGYNFQPFARDTIYNMGIDYSDVRRLSDLLGTGAAIPVGPGRDLLAASYRAALDAGIARGVSITGNQNLNPAWKFHQVARSAGLGPALSGNYVTASKRYIVQVFAVDTLFTPVSQQTGCQRLSETSPTNPAYAAIWAETYRVAPARYDPTSPFQQLAARLRLGAPLTGVYDTNLAGELYTIQVFALDTLYRGKDGVIRRMSDLPLPDKVGWPNASQKLVPTPQPEPEPRRLEIDVGPARRKDPAWPPPPPFNFLASRPGAVEAALGRIEWQRIPGSSDRDAIQITNGWDEEHLVVIDIPQLRKFRLAGYGKLRFHRRAATQLIQLFADWEEAGLLGLILSFDGAYNPRTIRAAQPGQTTNTLSNHAYGAAFDINAAQNPFMGQPALVGEHGSVRELVPLAYANGFYWGGHFSYRNGGHDGMHFEWAVEV